MLVEMAGVWICFRKEIDCAVLTQLLAPKTKDRCLDDLNAIDDGQEDRTAWTWNRFERAEDAFSEEEGKLELRLGHSPNGN